MRKKHQVPDSNHHNNHAITPDASTDQQVMNRLNRIINTQDRLNEIHFNLESFLKLAAQQIHTLTRATGAAVELVKNEDMTCRAATGSLAKSLGQRIDQNNSISGLCMSTHQIIRLDNTANDARINAEECKQIEAQSLAVAPLFHEGNVIGVLKIISKDLNAFNEIDIQTLHIIAGLISSAVSHQLISENEKKLSKEKSHAIDDLKKSERKLKHMAQHDYLTGLPNRSLFNHHLLLSLAKAKRKNQLIALMYMDVDHFAQINESMGHAIGDNVLYAFAQRLKQCIRSSDLAVRFGGDEFIVLIDDIKEAPDVIVIADKILHAVRQPFNINNKSLNLTTSIGIAFLKDKSTNADEFLKQAYQALYVSKNSGRNTYYIFDNDLLMETPLVK